MSVAIAGALGVLTSVRPRRWSAWPWPWAPCCDGGRRRWRVLPAHRYGRGRDVLALMVACAGESVGFRQAHAWFRLRGVIAALTRRAPVWSAMPRVGFATDAAPAEALVTVEA